MPSFRRTAPVALMSVLTLTGCNLVGSWCTVEVKPEDASFPIASATFAQDGTYCATHSAGGQTNTSAGTYRWNGSKLTLEPEGRPPQTYAGQWHLDGKLVLSEKTGAGRITAVLKKQKDEHAALPP